MLKLIFFTLMSHAAIGALVPMAFMSVATMGKMFFRFMSALAVMLIVFAFWASPFDEMISTDSQSVQSRTVATVYMLLAAAVLALVIMNLLLPRWTKLFLGAAIVFGLTAMALLAGLFPEAEKVVSLPGWVNAIGFVLSGLMLGGVAGTMITGHWYLVNHKLSIEPLRVATLIFIIASVMRFVFAGAMLLGVWLGGEPSQMTALKHLLTFSGEGIFFMARLLFGLVAPLIFGYMIWQTVKLQATQSATGILYAAVVFVILGEAFAKFIFYFMRLPV